jgi:hypothetical protein
MTTPTPGFPIVVLKISDKKTNISPNAADIVAAIKANADTFADPASALGTLDADITALVASEAAARNRMPGAVSQRLRDRLKVMNGLRHARDYVQGVAESQPTIAAAVVVIETARMHVKRRAQRRPKAVLAVKDGLVSGSVVLVALAVARTATYFWEVSMDQAQWTVRRTMQATVTIESLTPGLTYYFRFRSLTPRGGESDYSQPVSHIVR